MRILFISSGIRVPSARFRIHPVAAYLTKLGHTCVVRSSFPPKYDYFPWIGFRPSQILKRLVRRLHLVEATIRRFDVVYIDREIFDAPSYEMELQFRKVAPCLVLDFDDAVFLRYPEKFDHLIPMADLFVAGNSFLRNRFEGVYSRVFDMPTCIDLDIYRPVERSSTGKTPVIGSKIPVIGWMGTTFNLSYLKIVAPALRRLAKSCSFELRLIAGANDPLKEIDLSGVNVQFLPWNPTPRWPNWPNSTSVSCP